MEDTPFLSFDLVSLNPAMVFGVFLLGAVPTSPAHLNISNQIVYHIVSAGQDGDIPPTQDSIWVSVDDVALAHLRALEAPEAGGERYLLAAGGYFNQEIADVARKVARKHASSIPRGSPGLREADNHFGIDATKTKKAPGIKWQGLEEVLAELLPQLFQIQEGTEAIE